MTQLGKQGIKCDDTKKAQSLLEIDKFAKGESKLQSYAMTELDKRGAMVAAVVADK